MTTNESGCSLYPERVDKRRCNSEDGVSQSCVRVVSLFFFAVRPIHERDSRIFLTQLSSVRM